MEIIFFGALLIGIFFFMIYMPTVVMIKKHDKGKDEYESLLLFMAASALFIFITYLMSNFFVLKAVPLKFPVECEIFANMNCAFNGELTKEIAPSIHIFAMIFTQILVSFLYTYFIAMNIDDYKDKVRRILNMIIFFAVSIAASLISITIMSDIAFVSGVKYISLLITNAYIVLPMFYLSILLFKNRDVFKRK